MGRVARDRDARQAAHTESTRSAAPASTRRSNGRRQDRPVGVRREPAGHEEENGVSHPDPDLRPHIRKARPAPVGLARRIHAFHEQIQRDGRRERRRGADGGAFHRCPPLGRAERLGREPFFHEQQPAEQQRRREHGRRLGQRAHGHRDQIEEPPPPASAAREQQQRREHAGGAQGLGTRRDVVADFRIRDVQREQPRHRHGRPGGPVVAGRRVAEQPERQRPQQCRRERQQQESG